MAQTVLSFGHGYSARAFGRCLVARGWTVYGTTRSPDKARALAAEGIRPLLWDDETGIRAVLDRTGSLLTSVAPDPDGDPVLRRFGDRIAARAGDFGWVGYLSTTGVYGDHGGGWVDETTPLTPSTRRGRQRVRAEADWAAIPGLPLHIFRLAGIYGPGRGPFAKVRAGTARRIVKPDQVFSRIHVDDIAQVLLASLAAPRPGAVYNVCDDEAAPPQDVLALAAELLGVPVPPAIAFDQAEMTPMARSFYAESKRVDNGRIKAELGVSLAYPTYRHGLRALMAGAAGDRGDGA